MSTTFDDKNVERNQRKALQKESRNNITRILRAQPLLKINTQGLQLLHQSLGLLLDSLGCAIYTLVNNKDQKISFKTMPKSKLPS
jgi:hypothetical protein